MTCKLNVVTALALFTFLVTFEIAKAAESYPMTCRGDRNKFFIADVGDKTVLTVYFNGARQGASVRAPAKGECAWLDRGLDSTEPRILYFEFKGTAMTHGISDGGQYSNYYIRTKSNKNREHLKYILDAILQKQPFQVRAQRKRVRFYTDGRHEQHKLGFLVTHIGP